jgi:threonine aldolase
MSVGVTGLIQSGCTNQRSQWIFMAVLLAEKCNKASKIPVFLRPYTKMVFLDFISLQIQVRETDKKALLYQFL